MFNLFGGANTNTKTRSKSKKRQALRERKSRRNQLQEKLLELGKNPNRKGYRNTLRGNKNARSAARNGKGSWDNVLIKQKKVGKTQRRSFKKKDKKKFKSSLYRRLFKESLGSDDQTPAARAAWAETEKAAAAAYFDAEKGKGGELYEDLKGMYKNTRRKRKGKSRMLKRLTALTNGPQ